MFFSYPYQARRKAAIALEEDRQEKGLVVPLLPESEEDAKKAQETIASIPKVVRPANYEEQRLKERLSVQSSSIFGDQYKKKAPSTPSSPALPKPVLAALAAQRRTSVLDNFSTSRPSALLLKK